MIRQLLLLFILGMLSCAALAIDTGKAFEDPEMQARYEKLIAEIRCVTCQNQSIKDSNALIAADLKREIRRLMSEGKSDDGVAEFLVARYGDFILYRPRMAGKTLPLWIAPFLLVLFGGIAIFRVVRYRMALPVDEEAAQKGSTQ
jgi:cytochrome c-type biogenesis protein CcmH